jgi:hypothetical protein
MPKKSPNSVLNAPSVVEAIQAEKERRNVERVEEARRIVEELSGEYEHAKTIFFKVNGAKRILKNLG